MLNADARLLFSISLLRPIGRAYSSLKGRHNELLREHCARFSLRDRGTRAVTFSVRQRQHDPSPAVEDHIDADAQPNEPETRFRPFHPQEQAQEYADDATNGDHHQLYTHLPLR